MKIASNPLAESRYVETEDDNQRIDLPPDNIPTNTDEVLPNLHFKEKSNHVKKAK